MFDKYNVKIILSRRKTMKMKSLLYLMPLVALVSYLTGCASPKLAQTPLDSQEEEWKTALQGSYPSWKPPQTAPEVEEPAAAATIQGEGIIVDIAPMPSATPSPVIEERAAGNNLLEPQSYTVQKGDTLWKIAEDFYGDGKKWNNIYRMNKDCIRDPNKLKPGTRLVIPIE